MQELRNWLRMAALIVAIPALSFAQQTIDKEFPVDDGSSEDQPSACDMQPGNLVMNCGFETGQFPPWVPSGDLTFTGISEAVRHTGNFGVFNGPVGGLGGFLTQTLVTTPGQGYDLSFWLRNQGRPNRYTVSWNGVIVRDVTDVGDFGYMQVTIPNLIATGASTVLQFGFRNDPNFFWFDDVVVVPNCGM